MKSFKPKLGLVLALNYLCFAGGGEPGLVLDPFAGSETTLLMAKQLGRHFLGCDANAEYVELAKRRLKAQATTPHSCRKERA